MGEKLGGSASNPLTMILGGGGAAGGPAGLAQPTPFMPHSTGPGLQRGFSPGGQSAPYGIVPPAEARQQQRGQSGGQGGKGKGPPGLEGLMGGGMPGGLGGLLGGGGPPQGMPGTPGGDFTPGSGGMGDPMRVGMDWLGGKNPLESFMGSGSGSKLSNGRGGSKK